MSLAKYFLGRIKNRPLLVRVLSNSGWLAAEKIIRLVVGVFVTAWMARYLGPLQFGLLSYCQAVIFLFGAIGSMGLEYITVREFVRNRERQNIVLVNAFALRAFGAALAMVLSCVSILVFREDAADAIGVTLFLSAALLMQSADVLDYRYQAEMLSRPVTVIKSSVFLLLSVVRILLILQKAPLMLFAATYFLEAALVSFFLVRRGRRDGFTFQLTDISSEGSLTLLRLSWPLIIANAAIAVYYKVDQVLLGRFLDDNAVGVYSAAARISEAWYFVPVAIMAASAPTLALTYQRSYSDYCDQLARVARILTKLAIAFALLCTVFAEQIIQAVYGSAYGSAAGVLAVHAWAGVFACLGVTSSNWAVNSGMSQLVAYQAVVGAIFSVAGNLVLIPIYGTVGAAFALLISQCAATLLVTCSIRRTRQLFFLQLRALV